MYVIPRWLRDALSGLVAGGFNPGPKGRALNSMEASGAGDADGDDAPTMHTTGEYSDKIRDRIRVWEQPGAGEAAGDAVLGAEVVIGRVRNFV